MNSAFHLQSPPKPGSVATVYSHSSANRRWHRAAQHRGWVWARLLDVLLLPLPFSLGYPLHLLILKWFQTYRKTERVRPGTTTVCPLPKLTKFQHLFIIFFPLNIYCTHPHLLKQLDIRLHPMYLLPPNNSMMCISKPQQYSLIKQYYF